MKKFVNNLKRAAQENPMLALAATAAVITSTAKLIEAAGHAQGSRAYAKDVERRVKNQK